MPRKDPSSSFENAAIGFVYKSLINRDPNKRRIKPVESILSLDADLDDSESDDSDYNPANVDDDDIEIESDGDADNGDDKSGENKSDINKAKDTNGNNSDISDESDSSSNDEDEVEDDSSEKKRKQLYEDIFSGEEKINGGDFKSASVSQSAITENYKKIVICSVCLGDVSHSEDEIVECDACGISVHELCYGITADDAESIHSNASSASTEPWFCDPCKAGVKNPNCELCPNSNGIYKITDNGRWVHMVCALYTHGVTFVDMEKLRGPVLSDINYTRWGAKMCILCEDERFSQTGVCICCDAGMCKTFFHATCAQREGLTELRHGEEVDPYIAYCRLHSDRVAAKKRRRNYLALLAKNRFLMKSLNQNDKTIEDSINNQRTLSKLISQREKFLKTYHAIEPFSIAPNRRTPRLLEASPSAMRRLSVRSQLSGYSSKRNSYLIHEDVSDIRRKWYIQPAFSIEFISYYIDRNDRIDQMDVRSQELIKQNKQLKDLESTVFTKYSDVFRNTEKLTEENAATRAKILKYLTILGKFCCTDFSATDEERIKSLKLGRSILNLPEMQTNKNKDSCNSKNTNSENWNASASTSGANIFELKECASCKISKDQHLMALCDSCNLYYHLYCLDPPLRRMPKKTRFGGWQCSNCTEKDEEENEQEMARLMDHSESDNPNSTVSSVNENESSMNSDVNASTSGQSRRRLRENPKAAVKYSDHEESLLSTGNGMPSNLQSRGRPRNRSTNASTFTGKRGRKPKSVATSSSVSITSPLPASCRKRKLSVSQETVKEVEKPIVKEEPSCTTTKSHHTPPKKALPQCFGCKDEVQAKQSVRCDNCQNVYHFACLVPPCTKSPKRRGYTWCCYVCEKKGDKRLEHSLEIKKEAEDEKSSNNEIIKTEGIKKLKSSNDSEDDIVLVQDLPNKDASGEHSKEIKVEPKVIELDEEEVVTVKPSLDKSDGVVSNDTKME